MVRAGKGISVGADTARWRGEVTRSRVMLGRDGGEGGEEGRDVAPLAERE